MHRKYFPDYRSFTLLKLLSLTLIFIYSTTHASSNNHLCDKLHLISTDINITDNEKLFICDDKTKGWKKIPISQKVLFLRRFLESRAYYNPTIFTTPKKVTVSPGKKSFIRKVTFKGMPKEFYEKTYIGSNGKTLTKSQLDEIKTWAKNRLAAIGFPCSNIEVNASYKTGEVVINAQKGPIFFMNTIEREKNVNLKESALTRFDAFEVGDIYNEEYLNLSSARIINSGLVSYSYFSPNCENQSIKQSIMMAAPNFLTFGIGASSEELPLLNSSWTNSRIDSLGSSVTAKASLSNIRSSFEVYAKNYVFSKSPRLFLIPKVSFEKVKDDIFDTEVSSLSLALALAKDTSHKSFLFKITPSLITERNYTSTTQREIKLRAYETYVSVTSHDYEYFKASPRTGGQAKLRNESFTSVDSKNNVNGNSLSLSSSYLQNYGQFSPPLLIFGARFQFSTNVIQDLEDTPQRYRLYLGGIDSIRGFTRNMINNEERGFKSTGYMGLEARLNHVLPYNIQPFLLYDFAQTADQALQLNSDLYHSPGFGTRIESPFGSLRFSLAYGIDESELLDKRWSFHFSYGREF